jgi:Ala-tRNA(Pro) deacylase
MATRRIREYLDGNGARYVVIAHSPAYAAQEVAASAHVPGRSMAKVVVAVLDGRLALAVVPATRDVDFEALREATNSANARIADESEFADYFEGCKLGAIPPFGNLFGVETFVALSLARHPQIAFNAGTHTDVIVMNTEDYLRLAQPTLLHIATNAEELKAYAAPG